MKTKELLNKIDAIKDNISETDYNILKSIESKWLENSIGVWKGESLDDTSKTELINKLNELILKYNLVWDKEMKR